MDKLKAMTTFVAIAEEGSLTAAAAALQSSLPVVVRRLAALEAHLRVRLFNRTTRRVSLTDDGRRYLAQCRQVLAAVDEAERALAQEAGEPGGHLTLTAPVLYGQMYVAPAVTGFVQRYPGMRISLMLLDRVVDLLEEGFDLGVRIGALEGSTLIARPLASVRRVLVASPGWLRANGVPRHPRQLREVNCVRVVGSPSSWWSFHQAGRRFNVPVTGNLEFNHIAPAIHACAAGHGVGAFMSYQVAPFVERRELRLVLEAFAPPPQPVNLVYPHARLLPARLRLLIDWLVAPGTAAAAAPFPAARGSGASGTGPSRSDAAASPRDPA
jgi:DNA-binding transcriptional LysR family regulator